MRSDFQTTYRHRFALSRHHASELYANIVALPEKPTVKPGEILVRLQAAALNYVDLAIIEGRLASDLPLPIVPVADGCGVIEEVGDRVQD